MIKASELRIGNLVITPKKDVFRIDLFENVAMDGGKFGQIISPDTHPLTWYLEDLQPIPLTKEWMLKFGFKYSVSGEYYADSNHCVSETNKHLDHWVFIPYFTNDEDCHIKIKYVHQLQNLYFALMGQELLVKK